MVKAKKLIQVQTLKDIFHFIFPILLLIILPKGWSSFFTVYGYFVLKLYVYLHLKDQQNLSPVAVMGVILNAIFLVAYAEGI